MVGRCSCHESSSWLLDQASHYTVVEEDVLQLGLARCPPASYRASASPARLPPCRLAHPLFGPVEADGRASRRRRQRPSTSSYARARHRHGHCRRRLQPAPQKNIDFRDNDTNRVAVDVTGG